MRIGIFGGTFDPPHLAHLELARATRDQLTLDNLIWVPAAQNPLKQERKPASGRDRLKMVQATIEGEAAMSVSNIELTRSGLSYAIDTIREFKLVIEGELWFLMGTDQLASFSMWKECEAITRLARLAVATRPGFDRESATRNLPDFVPGVIDWIEMDPNKASSTLIRNDAQTHHDFGRWVVPAVERYIHEKHLYEQN